MATADPQHDPPTNESTGESAGCVVFLIDESTAMDARVADGTKSKAQCIATAVNSLLNQLTTGPPLDMAIVGYRGDGHGGADVGCRWGGPLADGMFVSSGQLAGAPAAVENRVRKIPGPGGVGVAGQQTVEFPIWYVPALADPVPPTAGYEFCQGLLSAQRSVTKPPLVISFVRELSPEDAFAGAVAGVHGMQSAYGPPLVFHAHLSSSGRVPPTLYPSADAHLPPGSIGEIFAGSSCLPEPFAVALRDVGVNVNPAARGMICNAKMVDLIRLLSLVKVYAAYRPPAVVTQEVALAPGEHTRGSCAEVQPVAEVPAKPQAAEGGLVVLLADRSVADLGDQKCRQVWTRLQDHANELLGQIAKRGKGCIETAVVTYGATADGQPDVQNGFAGPLAGRTFVADGDLDDGALRVEESTEQVSNGIGGLIAMTRKRAIFVDLEPTAATTVGPALDAVAGLLSDWRGQCPVDAAPAIVLHLTRGCPDPDAYLQAVAQLHQSATANGGVLLYHLVVTDAPHRSLAYPGQPTGIEDPGLACLWQSSSPLAGAEWLAVDRRTVATDSRGIVINGKFDLLLDGIWGS